MRAWKFDVCQHESDFHGLLDSLLSVESHDIVEHFTVSQEHSKRGKGRFWLDRAAALRTRAAQESERATTLPSRRAWWTIVPRTLALRVASSSSITITSTGKPIRPTASRRRTASATRFSTLRSITKKSRSLSRVSSPRAADPNRITRAGEVAASASRCPASWTNSWVVMTRTAYLQPRDRPARITSREPGRRFTQRREMSGAMELAGIEPATSCMPCRRSPS